MALAEFKYKAFISYSHVDEEWAAWLLKALESYRIPKPLVGKKTELGPVPQRLAPIFRDRDELPAAYMLTDRLFQALRASEFLIVLCSPNAAKSSLVNREIAEFKRHHGDGRVLCMIVGGKPFADDPDEECFPEELFHSYRKDGTRDGLAAEGLAADARPEGDGRRRSLLKIVAGMIGVGLNEVVNRDEVQRNQRMLGMGAVAALAMAVMSYLTYEAFTARNSALKAQQAAEIQLAHNEKLNSLLTSKLYEKLIGIGSLETLEYLNTEIIKLFGEQGMETLSDVQLFNITASLMRLGQAYEQQGLHEKARRIFENTLPILQDFYARRPNNSLALYNLQNNYYLIGYLAHRQGRYEDAKAAYEHRLNLVRFALARGFDTARWHGVAMPAHTWQEQVAAGAAKMCSLLSTRLGRPKEAAVYCKESMVLRQAAALEAPEDVAIRASLGEAYYHHGTLQLALGELEQAQDAFTARKKLFDELMAEFPADYNYRRRQCTALQELATMALLTGDLQTALSLSWETTENFQSLIARDPQNTLWLAQSALAWEQLAKTYLALGQHHKAAPAIHTARQQIEEALKRDAGRMDRRLVSYRVRLLDAQQVYYTSQDAGRALKILTPHLEALSTLNSKYLPLAGMLAHLGETHLFKAQLLTDTGDQQGAQVAREYVVNLLQNTETALDLPAKKSLSTAYMQLGRVEESNQLTHEITAAGFQKHASIQSR